MTEASSGKKPLNRALKVVLIIALALLCLALLIVAGVEIYLSSSLPGPQLSRQLTAYLRQPVSVQSVRRSGGAIVLKNVRIQNPAGFSRSDLLSAGSVTIAPDWSDMIAGRQRFRLIALDGISLNLEKNPSGAWNYSQLQKILTAKPSKKETLLEHLVIKNGALTVQGYGVKGVSLQVFNFATKGSLDSRIDLAFEDAARNRYLLQGRARPGADAALDLALTAPSLALKDAAKLLKLKNPSLIEGGKGSLKVEATLHHGRFGAVAGLSFTGLRLPGRSAFPVAGRLDLAADYDLDKDSLVLKKGSIEVARLGTVHGQGEATRLKGDRQFSLLVNVDQLDLSMLNILLPDETRRQLTFAGRLRCDALHIEGDKAGVKKLLGTLQLRDGAVIKEKRLLVEGLGGNVQFSRLKGGVLAGGKLAVTGRHEAAVIQALDLPLTLTLSSGMKPVKAELPALSATVMGTPLTGRVTFDAAKATPITATLEIQKADLAKFNDQFKGAGLHADSGTASLSVNVTGKSAQDFAGVVRAKLADARGSRGTTRFAVKSGSTTSTIKKTWGKLAAQGDARVSGLDMNGKAADAAFSYRLADNVLRLDGVEASYNGARLSLSRLTATIPVKQVAGRLTRYPLVVAVDGGQIRQRDLEIAAFSGRMRGSFNSDGAGKWLEGDAELSAKSVLFQGKKLAAPVMQATFSRPGAKANLAGELFGGKVAGKIAFDPFAPAAGQGFEIAVTGAEVSALTPFLPKGGSYHPSGGTVDLTATGSAGGRDGLSCRFDIKGRGISLTGAGEKTMVSGAGASLAGSFAGDKLVVNSGVLSAGPDLALSMKGEVAQVSTAKRRGTITFSLPKTPLDSMVDPFINLLPRFIQEATLGGSLGADGKIELQEGHQFVVGALAMSSVKLEVPSQHLVVDDLTGRFPFSLDLAGKGQLRALDQVSFSRENFPRLLEQLRRPGAGELITIGKVAFGGLQLGKVALNVTAANGLTDITSLRASLFEGELLGKAYVSMRNKLSYRGDLIVNDSSLKALCSMFPGITGYISGRVDGVISVSGQGSGVEGTAGFVHLWAREGKKERMVVSKEFLQRLAKQKLSGFFFSTDRPYDRAEIKALMQDGDLTFDTMTIQHTNFIGVKDLNVNIAPGQNRISLDHLLASIKEAAVRGAPSTGGKPAEKSETPEAPATEFKWAE